MIRALSRTLPALLKSVPTTEPRRSARLHSMAARGTKRSMPPKVGTHSGSFHCDEALGVFLLK